LIALRGGLRSGANSLENKNRFKKRRNYKNKQTYNMKKKPCARAVWLEDMDLTCASHDAWDMDGYFEKPTLLDLVNLVADLGYQELDPPRSINDMDWNGMGTNEWMFEGMFVY
jgi:hypothetical protein